jgi:hypothetical protein
MPALYANLPADIHTWIEKQAVAARTTKSEIVDLILREAMARGWTVEGGAKVRTPE